MKFFRRFFSLLDKRQRFVFQTITLSVGLLMAQLIWEDYRFLMVIILGTFSYLLTAWSLKEDIKGIEWGMLFILPVTFTMAVSLFYFLLPPRWISRLITGLIFAVGTYAVLLVENIYNVAAVRSIGLLRAAQSIGLLLTLIVFFLSANIIFAFRTYFFINFLLFFFLTLVLSFQSIWSVKLEPHFSWQTAIFALVTALILGEGALALSFWPIRQTVGALFLTASFYFLIGVLQQYLLERLFKNTIREYLIVFLFIFFILFLTTAWG